MELRCVVCTADLTRRSLAQRESHLNACLDAQRCDCPTCGREISQLDERQRQQHVNQCLDRAEAEAAGRRTQQEEQEEQEGKEDEREEDDEEEELQTQVAVELTQTQVAMELTQTQVAVQLTQTQEDDEDEDSEGECGYVCKICGADMSEINLMRRIRHVKQCGQKFGVRPGDMAEVEQAETLAARLDDKTPNAFAIMMKSSSGKDEAQAAGIGTDRRRLIEACW
ncbi:unnamed protein product [Phytophthora lilii]|uniref:Unnamed protein product n=1 Tax=Phytophthora lilii TaxID=2077276 RepID=A0A9W6TXD0_9STRA|nr:unnamed protein product [Phytophthora lilii]